MDCVNIFLRTISKIHKDSKKISEYVDGTSPKKISFGDDSKNNMMSEEIAVDKEFIIEELKLINMKNWQSIVSENVLTSFTEQLN